MELDRRALAGLSENAVIYLVVMLGVIAALTVLFVPAMLWKKCASCGARNMLDATECKRCKKPFPADRSSEHDHSPLP
jgi:hypothetical protein